MDLHLQKTEVSKKKKVDEHGVLTSQAKKVSTEKCFFVLILPTPLSDFDTQFPNLSSASSFNIDFIWLNVISLADQLLPVGPFQGLQSLNLTITGSR